MEFYSGQPENPAASVRDYCTGVLSFVIGNGYKLALPASSKFNLIVPRLVFFKMQVRALKLIKAPKIFSRTCLQLCLHTNLRILRRSLCAHWRFRLW